MVESLKELSRVCQKPRYKKDGNWMVRHFLRDWALPVTWLLLHTSVTANQVTTVSLIVGLSGLMLFAKTSPALFFLGALLVQLWYFLDHVDGQIARYRKTASLTGRFFDFVTHHIIHGVLFFSLGYYCFKMTDNSFFLFWGFSASLAMMVFNLLHDTKYKTFFERLVTFRQVSIAGSKAGEKAECESADKSERFGALRKLFSWGHKAAEIHVVMNILTLVAFCELFPFFAEAKLRLYLFIVYGVTVPMLAVVKLTYWIKNQTIDKEFDALFKPHRG
ncbi:MAG: CDP-alcohol phosphatidyltransferase family protein [Candidatus Omnitrophota bacterium]|nr:CDP-alcohol phosphatidyltransferase family protein [Candidatus Omnitrophota bacterium]